MADRAEAMREACVALLDRCADGIAKVPEMPHGTPEDHAEVLRACGCSDG